MNILLMDNRTIVAIVKDLIHVIDEDKEGFRLAAEASSRSDVKLLLFHYSEQRAGFAEELHQLEFAYGGQPAEIDSSTIQFHDGWAHLLDAVETHDSRGILSVCETGESFVMNQYRQTLSTDLPLDVQMVIGAQSLEVKAAHDKVRYLRDLALAA